MRSKTPYPCSGPSETALRISMSSVPCNSSICLSMSHSLLDALGIYRSSPRLSRRKNGTAQLAALGQLENGAANAGSCGLQKQCVRNLRRSAKNALNRDDNLSCCYFQRDDQLSRVFNLAQEFAPFARPEEDKTLKPIPKRYLYALAKERRIAGVQKLPGNPQTVAFGLRLNEQIDLIRLGAIEQVPLRADCRARTKHRSCEAVEEQLNPRPRSTSLIL